MADGGWRCPKGDRRSGGKREAPLSLESPNLRSLSDLNWWPEEEPDSPPNRRVWPADDPILPGRYGNLINSPQSRPKPSIVGASRQLFPGPNWGVSRRPLTARMGRSGGLAGGEETHQSEGDLHCHSSVHTTSTGPDGVVKKVPLRSVATMMAEIPWISPEKTSSSAGMKRSSPSEASSPPPTSKASRGLLSELFSYWKRTIACEEVSLVHSHPPITTTLSEAVVLGPAGGVEKETSSPTESPLLCPIEMCGETWDQCIVEADEYVEEMARKWREDNVDSDGILRR